MFKFLFVSFVLLITTTCAHALGGHWARLAIQTGGAPVGPIFLDTFTGADATPLNAHTPDQSPNGWVESSGRWYISVNKAWISSTTSTTAYLLSYTNTPVKISFDLSAAALAVLVYFNGTTSSFSQHWAFHMTYSAPAGYKLYESGVLRSSYLVTPTSPSNIVIDIVGGIFKITINGVYRPEMDYAFTDKGGGYIGISGRSGKGVDNLRVEYAP